MRTFDITADGVASQASFSEASVALLEELIDGWGVPRDARTLVLLAAPPGAGKTTISRVIEQLAHERLGEGRLQALSLDGFHFPNAYLATHEALVGGERRSLSEIKGAPETFDLPALASRLAKLADGAPVAWPAYDRAIHEPRADAIEVAAPIVLIEGNWLLLDEPGWRELSALASDTVFIQAEPGLLRDRLIGRKVRGGRSREEAERWFEKVDGPNIERALNRRVPARTTLALTAPGELIRAASR